MEKFRELLNDIQHHIDSDSDMGVPRLKQLWNDLSYAISVHEENNRKCLVEHKPVMTMYKYFVSFAHVVNDFTFFGNQFIELDRKIESVDVTREIQKKLEESKNLKQVIVINFILLETEPK